MAEEHYGEKYFTPEEAAEYLRVTPRWLRERSDVPAVVMGHKTVRYRKCDLDRWAAEHVYQAPKVGRPR
jgi:hypothetical protein